MGGSKAAQAMSKRELDDILKFGTEEMFKDDDNDHRIVYDDKAIDALLDRSKEGIIEKESGMDDYLSSFKVASYTVKDKDEPDVEVLKQEADVIDSDYWEKLLRHHFEQEQEYVASTLGKGKRVRKQVNYNDGHLADTNKMLRQAYDDGSDFDASELVEDSDEQLSDDDSRQKKYKDRDVLPPLLAKVGNQIEVYGFNPRQRRAFLTAVMRYGLPPKNFKAAKEKWCIHNLRGKTEKAFQSYTSMFLRHLCEPGMDNKVETYSDGVPREGVNRLQVLSRIGIMSLIKRKVEEYSSVNTFLHHILVGHITIQERSMTRLLAELKNANTATNTTENATPEIKKDEEANPVESKPAEIKDEEKPKIPVEEVKEEKMITESNGVSENKDSDSTVIKDEMEADVSKSVIESSNDESVDPANNPKSDEVIENGNDGEAAKATDNPPDANEKKEETALSDSKPPAEENSNDTASKDPLPPAPVPQPVTAAAAVPTTAPAAAAAPTVSSAEIKEEKNNVPDTTATTAVDGVTVPKFMFNIADGGFTELHVLWEAEEKRKFDNIWWRYHDYWLMAGAVVHGYGRWQDIQNDPRFDTINRPFARMSLDYKNKFIARRFKLLEQALIVEEQLKRATLMGVQQDNTHPAMSLQSRFAELECLAESHQHLSKESLSGNKPANAVLHKVLNQLETLLSDMKNDVTRLPTALAKVPPVTHRLNMSERAVLTRLATGGHLPVSGAGVVNPAGHPGAVIYSPPGGPPVPGVPMYATHHPMLPTSPAGGPPMTNPVYLPVHPTVLPAAGAPPGANI